MRIVLAHNFYQQPGGEDSVFRSEYDLLRLHGHDVVRYELHNDAVQGMGRLAVLGATMWNRRSHAEILALATSHRADIVHFHNTFPLISPSGYAAARAAGAAVVQTLHNFRLLCPGAVFFRDGKVCEQCLGLRIATPAIANKCYRDSRVASAAVTTMLATHRALGTWADAVDAYVTPTRFARDKFVAGGLPPDRLFVKPNFLDPDPGPGDGDGGYAIFVGRLSHEKGLGTLLAAWEVLSESVPLKIVGDGPLAPQVQDLVARNRAVEWLGRRAPAEVYDLIGRAALLVFPSECYETFGRVAAEAFAKGTPVIASNHGAMADVVAHDRTGLVFRPGDGPDLARQVRRLLGDPPMIARTRAAARREYLDKFTGPINHEQLLAIYRRALATAGRHRDRPAA